MNVIPFGAKSPTNTVVGVSADSNGNIITKKNWENPVSVIFTGVYNDTVSHTQDGVDVSDCALFSLRIANQTSSEVTLTFRSDVTSNDVTLKDVNGQDYFITVPADKRFMMITPDDYPFLQWIRNLRLSIKFNTAASSGTLTVYLVKKK